MADEPRYLYQGTSELFEVVLKAKTSIVDGTSVQLSFDEGVTWRAASLEGSADVRRKASLTVSNTNLPSFPFDNRLLVNLGGTINDIGRVIGKVVPLT